MSAQSELQRQGEAYGGDGGGRGCVLCLPREIQFLNLENKKLQEVTCGHYVVFSTNKEFYTASSLCGLCSQTVTLQNISTGFIIIEI